MSYGFVMFLWHSLSKDGKPGRCTKTESVQWKRVKEGVMQEFTPNVTMTLISFAILALKSGLLFFASAPRCMPFLLRPVQHVVTDYKQHDITIIPLIPLNAIGILIPYLLISQINMIASFAGITWSFHGNWLLCQCASLRTKYSGISTRTEVYPQYSVQ